MLDFYLFSISYAFYTFPIAAALFTLPFLVVQKQPGQAEDSEEEARLICPGR